MTRRVSVEAGVSLGWDRWVGPEGAIIALDRFGASAPAARALRSVRLHGEPRRRGRPQGPDRRAAGRRLGAASSTQAPTSGRRQRRRSHGTRDADGPSLRLPDDLRATVDAAIARAVDERWASRSGGPRHARSGPATRAVAATIAQPARLARRARRLHGRGRGAGAPRRRHPSARASRDAVVCGMGGSSLAPEVLARCFPRSAHGLRVRVLDSTDPEAVAAIDAATRPRRTRSASSPPSPARPPRRWRSWPTSGPPTQHRVGRFPAERHGRLPSSPSPTRAQPRRPSPTATCSGRPSSTRADVGGRYSALTYVGLVPPRSWASTSGRCSQDAARCWPAARGRRRRQPGRRAGRGHGCPRPGRQGQADLRHRAGPGAPGRLAGAAHRGVHGQARHGHRAGGRRAARPDPRSYGSDRVFVRLGPDRRGVAGDTDASAGGAGRGRPPGHRPAASTGGAWVAGEFVRWEVATADRRRRARASTRSTSPTSPSPSRTPARVLDEHRRATARCPAEDPVAVSGILRLYGDATLGRRQPRDDGDRRRCAAHLGARRR